MSYALAQFDEGDILVFYGFPRHYAVYTGCDKIIHYQRDSDGKDKIIEESIHTYWKRIGNSSFGTVSGGMSSSKKILMKFPAKAKIGPIDKAIAPREYNGPEVVERARSKIGREKYYLTTENCEHFAFWCKYGITQSDQIEECLATGLAAAGGGAGIVVGTIMGSVVPVVGTLIGGAVGTGIGAVIGGGIGWFSSKIARVRRAASEDGGLS